MEMNIDNDGLSSQDFGQLTSHMRNVSVTIQKLSDNGVKEQSFEQVLHMSELVASSDRIHLNETRPMSTTE